MTIEEKGKKNKSRERNKTGITRTRMKTADFNKDQNEGRRF